MKRWEILSTKPEIRNKFKIVMFKILKPPPALAIAQGYVATSATDGYYNIYLYKKQGKREIKFLVGGIVFAAVGFPSFLILALNLKDF